MMASAGRRLRGDIASCAACDGLLPMGGVTSGEGGSRLVSSDLGVVVAVVLTAVSAVRTLPVGSDRVGRFAIAADIFKSPDSLRSVASVFVSDAMLLSMMNDGVCVCVLIIMMSLWNDSNVSALFPSSFEYFSMDVMRSLRQKKEVFRDGWGRASVLSNNSPRRHPRRPLSKNAGSLIFSLHLE